MSTTPAIIHPSGTTAPTIIHRQCCLHWWIVSVFDSRNKHKIFNISANFHKNLKRPQWDTQGPVGTESWKKPEVENLVSGSLETEKGYGNRRKMGPCICIYVYFGQLPGLVPKSCVHWIFCNSVFTRKLLRILRLVYTLLRGYSSLWAPPSLLQTLSCPPTIAMPAPHVAQSDNSRLPTNVTLFLDVQCP